MSQPYYFTNPKCHTSILGFRTWAHNTLLLASPSNKVTSYKGEITQCGSPVIYWPSPISINERFNFSMITTTIEKQDSFPTQNFTVNRKNYKWEKWNKLPNLALFPNLDVAPQAPFRFHSSTSSSSTLISAFYDSSNSIGQGSMGMKVNDMEWVDFEETTQPKARGWWNPCFPCPWLVQREGETNKSQEIEAPGSTNPLSPSTNWGPQFSCSQRNGINQFICAGFCAETDQSTWTQPRRIATRAGRIASHWNKMPLGSFVCAKTC